MAIMIGYTASDETVFHDCQRFYLKEKEQKSMCIAHFGDRSIFHALELYFIFSQRKIFPMQESGINLNIDARTLGLTGLRSLQASTCLQLLKRYLNNVHIPSKLPCSFLNLQNPMFALLLFDAEISSSVLTTYRAIPSTLEVTDWFSHINRIRYEWLMGHLIRGSPSIDEFYVVYHKANDYNHGVVFSDTFLEFKINQAQENVDLLHRNASLLMKENVRERQIAFEYACASFELIIDSLVPIIEKETLLISWESEFLDLLGERPELQVRKLWFDCFFIEGLDRLSLSTRCEIRSTLPFDCEMCMDDEFSFGLHLMCEMTETIESLLLLPRDRSNEPSLLEIWKIQNQQSLSLNRANAVILSVAYLCAFHIKRLSTPLEAVSQLSSVIELAILWNILPTIFLLPSFPTILSCPTKVNSSSVNAVQRFWDKQLEVLLRFPYQTPMSTTIEFESCRHLPWNALVALLLEGVFSRKREMDAKTIRILLDALEEKFENARQSFRPYFYVHCIPFGFIQGANMVLAKEYGQWDKLLSISGSCLHAFPSFRKLDLYLKLVSKRPLGQEPLHSIESLFNVERSLLRVVAHRYSSFEYFVKSNIMSSMLLRFSTHCICYGSAYDVCPICMDDRAELRLRCGHHIHHSCIAEYICSAQESNPYNLPMQCPICRLKLFHCVYKKCENMDLLLRCMSHMSSIKENFLTIGWRKRLIIYLVCMQDNYIVSLDQQIHGFIGAEKRIDASLARIQCIWSDPLLMNLRNLHENFCRRRNQISFLDESSAFLSRARSSYEKFLRYAVLLFFMDGSDPVWLENFDHTNEDIAANFRSFQIGCIVNDDDFSHFFLTQAH